MMPDNCECCPLEIGDGADCKRSRYDDEKQEVVPGSQCPFVLLTQWEEKARNWMASPEAAQRLDGYRELAGKLAATEESLGAKKRECERLRAADATGDLVRKIITDHVEDFPEDVLHRIAMAVHWKSEAEGGSHE